jgi:hypothetical protein
MGEHAGGLYRGFLIFSAPDQLRSELTITATLQPDTVARLMASLRNGDHEAACRLVELFAEE